MESYRHNGKTTEWLKVIANKKDVCKNEIRIETKIGSLLLVKILSRLNFTQPDSDVNNEKKTKIKTTKLDSRHNIHVSNHFKHLKKILALSVSVLLPLPWVSLNLNNKTNQQ